MVKTARLAFALAGVIFYIAIAYCGAQVVNSSKREADLAQTLALMSMPEQALERSAKTALERLTLGVYQGARPLRAEQARQYAALAQAQAETRRWSLACLGLVTVLVMALLAIRSRMPAPSRARLWAALHLYASAVILLAIGVTAPILTIDAGQDVAWLGRVVLSHQTKSLLGTVDDLLARGHWPVALLLAGFSLAVPSVKLALCILALLTRLFGSTSRWSELSHEVLGHLGKWSMTDVFVVAVLVAFLSANQAQTTNAAIGVGLYFFAAHVVLGMLAHALAPIRAQVVRAPVD